MLRLSQTLLSFEIETLIKPRSRCQISDETPAGAHLQIVSGQIIDQL